MHEEARAAGSAPAKGNDDAFVSSLKDEQLVVNAGDHVVACGHHRREDVLDGVAERNVAGGWQLVALTEAAQPRQPSPHLPRFTLVSGSGDRALGGKIP